MEHVLLFCSLTNMTHARPFDTTMGRRARVHIACARARVSQVVRRGLCEFQWIARLCVGVHVGAGTRRHALVVQPRHLRLISTVGTTRPIAFVRRGEVHPDVAVSRVDPR